MAKPSRTAHPLCGANLTTLWQASKRGGGAQAGHRARMASAWAAALGRLPFTLGERAYAKIAAPKQIEPPIFILGHWRSGTTHLYNIFGQSPQFGTVSPFATALPWDMLSIGTLFRPALERSLPEHRYIDNVAVTPDAPQEDEIALANMTPNSYYHALYFPQEFEAFFDRGVFFKHLSKSDIKDWDRTVRRLYAKLTMDQGGRRLVIKNPVYTARPQHLLRLFPGAKFIHIHRDPYKVFVSMRNFYDKLLAEFALQDYSHLDIDQIILDTYDEMMGRYINETAIFSPNQLVEISYDRLQRAPLECLEQIYSQLELPGFEKDAEPFAAYLESIQDYKKNAFRPPQAMAKKIASRWRRYFDHWGYVRDLPPS
ncbi:MAG: sulfotransferase [Pseudomonadota bacterium]